MKNAKHNVRAVWPFAVAGQDSVTKKWFVKKSWKRLVFDAPTEEAAWSELWEWMKNVIRSNVR